MSNELKTLDGIGLTGDNKCSRCNTIGEKCGTCLYNDLKKEAIKIRKQIWDADTNSNENALCNGAICGFIETFFNVEENLK